MGEGEGGGGQNKDLLVLPPLHPLPRWGGEIFWVVSKMLEINCQNVSSKNNKLKKEETQNNPRTFNQNLRFKNLDFEFI
jgi:hypothetical protein